MALQPLDFHTIYDFHRHNLLCLWSGVRLHPRLYTVGHLSSTLYTFLEGILQGLARRCHRHHTEGFTEFGRFYSYITVRHSIDFIVFKVQYVFLIPSTQHSKKFPFKKLYTHYNKVIKTCQVKNILLVRLFISLTSTQCKSNYTLF